MKRLFLTILFVIPLVLNAQKVAVVLSGGGAKGFSHIGVLKALEENNIPIDYIAGTSIGAIVGGLYASGYSPTEIETLMTAPEFKRWASGEIDAKYQYYYKRKEPNSSWISLPFEYKKRFKAKLSFNLVPTHVMDITFMEILAGPAAAANYNFDSLFIPFRCVASDIESSKAVIFKSGQLSDAIRASMSVPFYFSPIKIGDKLLFDGGMYNNFPVDVAYRDFEPDVIIGSKAGSNFAPPEQDDIISQLQNMLMSKTDYNYIPGKGVLIEPNLGDMNITDFSRVKEFIDSGYLHTMNKIEIIESLIDRRSNEVQLKQKRIDFFNKKPLIVIDRIEIEGLNDAQKLYVNNHIRRKKALLTLSDVKKEYYKLIADDKIKSIYPRLTYSPESSYYNLSFDVQKMDKFLVEFGGLISSGAYNQGFVGFQYNYLNKRAASYSAGIHFGRVYSGINLRTRIDYPANTPYFLQFEYTSHYKDYFKNATYFIDDLEPSFLVQRESFLQANFGIPLGGLTKLTAGVSGGILRDEYYQSNNFTRSDVSAKTDFSYYSPSIRIEQNTLNRKKFATEGYHISLLLRYVVGREKFIPGSDLTPNKLFFTSVENDHNYYLIHGIYDQYFNLYRESKIGLYVELLLSNKQLFNNYTASMLSAYQFQPFADSKMTYLPSYRANSYLAVGLKSIIPVFGSFELRSEAYILQPYQQILNNNVTFAAYYGEVFELQSIMASVSLIFNTPLGPVSFSTNYYQRHQNKFSFIVSFGYSIFNRSAMK